MEKPENCPDLLYQIMQRCWQHRPSARPTFMDIIEELLPHVDDTSPNFSEVSFYHHADGQRYLEEMRRSKCSSTFIISLHALNLFLQ